MGGHSRKKVDLTGQRYGHLAVLAPAENIGGRTAWRCPCDCGRETVVKTYHLRSSHTTSCGCVDGFVHYPEGVSYPPGVSGRASLTYVEGTCLEILRSKTVRRNNTSGVPGVDWMAKKERWRASICFKGKRRYLGSYKKFEDAVEARKNAEAELFDTFLEAYPGRAPRNRLRDTEESAPKEPGVTVTEGRS